MLWISSVGHCGGTDLLYVWGGVGWLATTNEDSLCILRGKRLTGLGLSRLEDDRCTLRTGMTRSECCCFVVVALEGDLVNLGRIIRDFRFPVKDGCAIFPGAFP
jgi:hypothetical protein